MNWKIKLLLDGVDRSSSLIQTLTIEAEENTAKIAEFTLMAHAGKISVTQWLGKSVKIFFLASEEVLIFEGVVDEPVYDPTTQMTTFTCSDQFQNYIQSLSKSDIDNLIQGYYAPVVFESVEDHWEYMQVVLSTVPVCLDLDNQQKLRRTPWEAKKTPDLILSEDDILYQSIQVQLSNRRDMVNQCRITVDYRYSILKQRDVSYQYAYTLSMCEQLKRNATMPNVDMIEQAIDGTGWCLKHKVQYQHPQESGWVDCGAGAIGYLIKESVRNYLVQEAHFSLSKRYLQSSVEHYHMTIQAPQSIRQLGEMTEVDSVVYEVDYNTEHFMRSTGYQPPIAESYLDENGDYIYPARDDARLQQAMITKMQQAKTKILKSHRNNLVTFQMLLDPLITRQHTIKLDTVHVQAQGKVKHIVHHCDFTTGSCLSTVTLAISRSDDVIVQDSHFEFPVRKMNSAENAPSIALPTHIGGAIEAALYDPEWDGYTGNEKIQAHATPYPERFAITTPSLESAQHPLEETMNITHAVAIPNELLLLTA